MGTLLFYCDKISHINILTFVILLFFVNICFVYKYLNFTYFILEIDSFLFCCKTFSHVDIHGFLIFSCVIICFEYRTNNFLHEKIWVFTHSTV